MLDLSERQRTTRFLTLDEQDVRRLGTNKREDYGIYRKTAGKHAHFIRPSGE